MAIARRVLGDGYVGDALIQIVTNEIEDLREEKRPYWSRKLSEAADSAEDIAGLVAVINDQSLSQAHSAAKKSLRLIDIEEHGPELEETMETSVVST